MAATAKESAPDKLLDVMDEAMIRAENGRKVVSISHNHSGTLHALRADGRIFKYERDPQAVNMPGIVMKWQEIVGP